MQLLLGVDALPLAYVTPEEVVAYVVSGRTPPKRERRLWKVRKHVIRACKESLAEAHDDELVALRDLLSQAIRAFRQLHMYTPRSGPIYAPVATMYRDIPLGQESDLAGKSDQGVTGKLDRNRTSHEVHYPGQYRPENVPFAIAAATGLLALRQDERDRVAFSSN